MELTHTDESGNTVMKFEGALLVSELAGISAELSESVGGSGDLVMDIALVTDCDTAGAQALCTVAKTARGAGRRVAVTGASASIVESMKRVGILLEDVVDSLEVSVDG